MTSLKWHLRFWWAKLRNDFKQITLQRLDEKTVVEQVMSGLKRDPVLRKVIEEEEAKQAALDKTEGQK